MNLSQRAFLIALLVLSIFSACKKESDDEKEGDVELKVTIYNTLLWSSQFPKGQAASGITVEIYRNKQDVKDHKPFKTGITVNGIAAFRVPKGSYFFIAKGENGITNIPSQGVKNAADFEMGYAQDGLFQSLQQVQSLPYQQDALQGNFRWKDINGDGVISHNDLLELPYEEIIVKDEAKEIEILIGLYQNISPITENPVAETDLLLTATDEKLLNFRKKAIVLDAVFSDDADCSGALSAYCVINNLDILPSDNKIKELFVAAYQVVAATNLSIRNIGASSLLSADVKKSSIAQMKGYRGYIYMMLANLFGTSPLVTQYSTNITTPPGSSTQAELYAQAKRDLIEAQEDLPSVWVETDGRRHISKMACVALRAKIALYQKDFALAESLALQVMNQNAYQFNGNANNVFENLTDQEIIWSGGETADTYYASLLNKGKYRPLMRLAEVYLIKAEALVGQAKYTEAHSLLTFLASRRSYTLSTTINAASVTMDFQEVWKREMYREGNRMACLNRWEKAQEVLGNRFQPHFRLLPIPTTELMLNQNIVQNQGYPN